MDAALAQMLREIGEALIKYADAAEQDVSITSMTWNQRVEKQRLVLRDITDLGGSVPRKKWLEIAASHGYAGRGVSGFFREGDTGLLALEGDTVRITDRGRARLAGEG